MRPTIARLKQLGADGAVPLQESHEPEVLTMA